MSAGIAAWGAYLPYWRLQRSAIASVLGSGGGRGTRAVASYDEDTTTLGVEAGRRALAVGPGAANVQDLFFSTPDPGYLDKTSATTVHAALGLTRACGAYDFAGSSRSAVATLLQGVQAAAAAGVPGPSPPTTRTRRRSGSKPDGTRWRPGPAPEPCRTSSSPRRTPVTWTRRAPPRCMRRSA